jgi:hypothetical protein
MPNRNGTGPLGQGSLTGWGRGRCRRNKNLEKLETDKPETENTIIGVGRGGNPYGGGNGKCWGGGRNRNNNTNK